MTTNDSGGPHVQVATFCRQAIVEQGTGSLSLIGLVERVMSTAIGAEVPDEMPPVSLNTITLAVCLWADQAKGRYAVKIRPEDPSGHQMEPMVVPIQLEGGARGVNVIQPMNLTLSLEGVYWFDVLFVPGAGHPDRLLSRVPLEVIYQPRQIG